LAARSAWTGYLKFSLVSIPVKAYTAVSSSSGIRLNQLHADCNSRIQYKKVCPAAGWESSRLPGPVVSGGRKSPTEPHRDREWSRTTVALPHVSTGQPAQ
jgi:hypothetical protein